MTRHLTTIAHNCRQCGERLLITDKGYSELSMSHEWTVTCPRGCLMPIQSRDLDELRKELLYGNVQTSAGRWTTDAGTGITGRKADFMVIDDVPPYSVDPRRREHGDLRLLL